MFDLSANPISEESAQVVYRAIIDHNDKIRSFGDLSKNLTMGVTCRGEIERTLKTNGLTSEMKRATILKTHDQGNLTDEP